MRQCEFVPSRPLTGEDGEYFFGYYDVPAYSADERYHLVHRAAFRGRLPRPEIMFLDEPTTGLDPQSRRDLWKAVRGMTRQGMTVLLTTQYLEEADQLADRIGFIADGRLIAVGTPAELKARYGGKTLTIRLAEGADADGVSRLLKSAFGLESQREEDGRIVKTSARNAETAHAAVGALLDGGTDVEDFALGEPSLEDVYFALNAARAREAAV